MKGLKAIGRLASSPLHLLPTGSLYVYPYHHEHCLFHAGGGGSGGFFPGLGGLLGDWADMDLFSYER
jgi:hypothetical protein